ncbi:hypothetical protein BFW01_g1676 [Lasiodiplodia theobromae]|nr:hypothetical protein BFW01_g1676 [Lasiodiplodia theobromae]
MSNYGSESSFAKSTGETGVTPPKPGNIHGIIHRERKLLGFLSPSCSTPKLKLNVVEYYHDLKHEKLLRTQLLDAGLASHPPWRTGVTRSPSISGRH